MHIIRTIGYLLLTLVIALSVLFLLTAIPQTGLKSRIVTSGSMEPAISTGAVIFTSQQDSYEVGETVTFRYSADGQAITHRIVAQEEEAGELLYETKGDANEDPDVRRITEGQISGGVFLSIPYLGRILAFASTGSGMLVIGAFIFMLLVGLQMKDWISEDKS